MRVVRRLVSKNRVRFQRDGFDLDLAYITDRIVAMAYPSEGGESLFRNPMSEARAFLDRYHPDAYRVYNLCSEKSYDAAKLGGRVIRFACHDMQPPSLSAMKSFCEDASAWLDESESNVVVVHCKAGKGRTGVLVCCLLLWRGLCRTPEQAIEHYGRMRTRNGKGVTIASQVRYIGHFHRLYIQNRPTCSDISCTTKTRNGDGEQQQQQQQQQVQVQVQQRRQQQQRVLPRRVRIRKLAVNGLPKDAIDGSVVKVACRGKADGAAQTVLTARAIGPRRGWWRCLGAAPCMKGQEDVAVIADGDRIVIDDRVCEETIGSQVHSDGFEDDDDDDDCGLWEEKLGTKVLMGGEGQHRKRGSGLGHVFDWDLKVQVSSVGGENLFHAWENTAFLPESGVMKLHRDGLDKVKGRLKDVGLEIHFEVVGEGEAEDAKREEEADEEHSVSEGLIGCGEDVTNASVRSVSNASSACNFRLDSELSETSDRPLRWPLFGMRDVSWPQFGRRKGEKTADELSDPGVSRSWDSFNTAWKKFWIGNS